MQASPRWSTLLGVGGAVAGCGLGLIPAAGVLLGQPVRSLRVAWDVPYGAFFVQIDPLSAFFLLPIFGLSALAAIYGAEYMRTYRDEESAGLSWFFFDLLLASMAMVVVARNALLFLVAWEVMALTSFFLVTFQDEEESVRSAGWTYLVATHLGTACLLSCSSCSAGAPAHSISTASRRPRGSGSCSSSPWSASGRRRASCRSMSGCRRHTPRRRRTSRR